MANEKKARKMGWAEKDVHKEKTRTCPLCVTGVMKWCRVNGNMMFWCPTCGATRFDN